MDMFSPFIGVGHVLYLYHKMANFYRSAKVRESQIELSLLGILNLSLTFMYDQKHFTRCKGDKTQCPSRTVRQKARTDLTNRKVIS